jgi:hypothetical protein
MSQAQRAVIALFVCLVLWLGWLDRTSSRQPPTNKGTETYAEKSSGIKTVQQSENKITDWLLVLFNGLLVGSTVLLWRANNRSAKIAERSLTEVERAFVFIDGFNVELTTALDSDSPSYEWLPERYRQDPGIYITRFAAQPRWKNGGNTPTESLTLQVNWSLIQGTASPNYSYRTGAQQFFIAPKAVETTDYIEMPGVQALVDWSHNPVGIPPWALIWGRADYRDVFGKPHFIEWCYQLRLSRPVRRERMIATFSQWNDYNRSDNAQENS